MTSFRIVPSAVEIADGDSFTFTIEWDGSLAAETILRWSILFKGVLPAVQSDLASGQLLTGTVTLAANAAGSSPPITIATRDHNAGEVFESFFLQLEVDETNENEAALVPKRHAEQEILIRDNNVKNDKYDFDDLTSRNVSFEAEVELAGSSYNVDFNSGAGADIYIISRYQSGDMVIRDEAIGTAGTYNLVKFDFGVEIIDVDLNEVTLPPPLQFIVVVADIKLTLSTGAVVTIYEPSAVTWRYQVGDSDPLSYDDFKAKVRVEAPDPENPGGTTMVLPTDERVRRLKEATVDADNPSPPMPLPGPLPDEVVTSPYVVATPADITDTDLIHVNRPIAVGNAVRFDEVLALGYNLGVSANNGSGADTYIITRFQTGDVFIRDEAIGTAGTYNLVKFDFGVEIIDVDLNEVPLPPPLQFIVVVADIKLTLSTGAVVNIADPDSVNWRYQFGDGELLDYNGLKEALKVEIPDPNDPESTVSVLPQDDRLRRDDGVAIEGARQVNQELTANIRDYNGIASVLTRQWQVSDDNGATWENISGATDEKYLLTASEQGDLIRVEVTYRSSGPETVAATSDATAAIAAAGDGTVVVSGERVLNGLLRAEVTDGDGVPATGVTYQWQVSDSEDGSTGWTNLATGGTYRLTRDEIDKYVRVRVTYTDDAGNDEDVTVGLPTKIHAIRPRPVDNLETDALPGEVVNAPLAVPFPVTAVDEAPTAFAITLADDDNLRDGAVADSYIVDETFDITQPLMEIGFVDEDGADGVNIPQIVEDAAVTRFEIREEPAGSGVYKLYFKSDVVLDQDGSTPMTSYSVTLRVNHGDTSPEGAALANKALTFTVSQVNEAPTWEEVTGTTGVIASFDDPDSGDDAAAITLYAHGEEIADPTRANLMAATGIITLTATSATHTTSGGMTITRTDGDTHGGLGHVSISGAEGDLSYAFLYFYAVDDDDRVSELPYVYDFGNEAPSFANSNYGFDLEVDQVGTVTPVELGTVTATDPEGGTLAYALSGTGSNLFTVGSGSGVINYTGPGEDDDNPPTSYALTLTARDTRGREGTTTININIVDVDLPPAFDSANVAEYEVNEGASGVLATITAADPDRGDTVEYSLADDDNDPTNGDDSELFTIDSGTGEITWNNPAAYDPVNHRHASDTEKSTYTFNVVATSTHEDEAPLTASYTVTVHVANVQVPPVFEAGPMASATVAENTSAADVIHRARAADADNDDITYALGGDDAGLFNFNVNSEGYVEVTFAASPNFEDPASSDGDNDYVFTLTATSTGSDGADLSATQTVAVTVRDADDIALSIAGGATATETREENSPAHDSSDTEGPEGTVAYRPIIDDDAINAPHRWTLGGGDAAYFGIDAGTEETSGTGAIWFRQSPNFEAQPEKTSYTVTLTVTATPTGGGAAETATQTVTINIEDVDEDPVWNTHANEEEVGGAVRISITRGEGAGLAVTTVAASDEDAGDSVTYALSGDDANLFDVDPGGVITFKNAPDFETEAENGGDNVYRITVEATSTGADDRPHLLTRDVVVTVTDVDEPTTAMALEPEGGSRFILARVSGNDRRLAELTFTDPDSPATNAWQVGDFTLTGDDDLVELREDNGRIYLWLQDSVNLVSNPPEGGEITVGVTLGAGNHPGVSDVMAAAVTFKVTPHIIVPTSGNTEQRTLNEGVYTSATNPESLNTRLAFEVDDGTSGSHSVEWAVFDGADLDITESTPESGRFEIDGLGRLLVKVAAGSDTVLDFEAEEFEFNAETGKAEIALTIQAILNGVAVTREIKVELTDVAQAITPGASDDTDVAEGADTDNAANGQLNIADKTGTSLSVVGRDANGDARPVAVDVDAADTVVDGQYGTLTISPDGAWSYALDNSRDNVRALTEDTFHDVFTLTFADADADDDGNGKKAYSLEIAVAGRDADPVVSAHIDSSEAVALFGDTSIPRIVARGKTEDGGADRPDVVVDGADKVVEGQYGRLTIDRDGTWSYELDESRASTQGIDAPTVEDVFTFAANSLESGDTGTPETLSISIRDAATGAAGGAAAVTKTVLREEHFYGNGDDRYTGIRLTVDDDEDGADLSVTPSDWRFYVEEGTGRVMLKAGAVFDHETTGGWLPVGFTAEDSDGNEASTEVHHIPIEDAAEERSWNDLRAYGLELHDDPNDDPDMGPYYRVVDSHNTGAGSPGANRISQYTVISSFSTNDDEVLQPGSHISIGGQRDTGNNGYTHTVNKDFWIATTVYNEDGSIKALFAYEYDTAARGTGNNPLFIIAPGSYYASLGDGTPDFHSRMNLADSLYDYDVLGNDAEDVENPKADNVNIFTTELDDPLRNALELDHAPTDARNRDPEAYGDTLRVDDEGGAILTAEEPVDITELVLANDLDPDSPTKPTIVSVAATDLGTATVTGEKLTYDADGKYYAIWQAAEAGTPVEFTYTVEDNEGRTDPGDVTIDTANIFVKHSLDEEEAGDDGTPVAIGAVAPSSGALAASRIVAVYDSAGAEVTGGNLFALDSASGALTYIGPAIDYDDVDRTVDGYAVVVELTLDDGATERRVAIVSLENLDDNAPQFNASPGPGTNAGDDVDENTPGGTVLYTFDMTDADGEAVTYHLSGGIRKLGGSGDAPQDLFQIEGNTLKLHADHSLDYETGWQYAVTVEFRSTFPGSTPKGGNFPFRIDVNDLDEPISYANPTATAQLDENADGSSAGGNPNGIRIGAEREHAASDEDTQTGGGAAETADVITYSIATVRNNDGNTDVTADNLFQISSDGTLTYHGTGEDYESAVTQYAVTIRATSSGDGNARAATKTVTVEIRDQDDLPVITSSTASVSVDENIADDFVIYNADGSDEDGDTVTFGLVVHDSNDQPVTGVFEINPDNGEVTLVDTASLRDEVVSDRTYTLFITPRANGVDGRTEEIALTVNNVSEHPVVFEAAREYLNDNKGVELSDHGGRALSDAQMEVLFVRASSSETVDFRSTGYLKIRFTDGDNASPEHIARGDSSTDEGIDFVQASLDFFNLPHRTLNGKPFAYYMRMELWRDGVRQVLDQDDNGNDITYMRFTGHVPANGPVETLIFPADVIFDEVRIVSDGNTSTSLVGRLFRVEGAPWVVEVDLEAGEDGSGTAIELATYTATDDDPGTTISYAIDTIDDAGVAVYAVKLTRDENGEVTGSTRTDVSDDGLFAIHPTTGVFTYVGSGETFGGAVDHYEVAITATSNDGSTMDRIAKVNIVSYTPAFTSAETAIVNEDIAGDFVIYTARAANSFENTVTYSMSVVDGIGNSVPVDSLFAIEQIVDPDTGQNTGVIKLAAGQSLNYDTVDDGAGRQYTFTITASLTSDVGPRTATRQVVLEVRDVDRPIVFDVATASVLDAATISWSGRGLTQTDVDKLTDGSGSGYGQSFFRTPEIGDKITLDFDGADHKGGSFRLVLREDRPDNADNAVVQFFRNGSEVGDPVSFAVQTAIEAQSGFDWYVANAPEQLVFDKAELIFNSRKSRFFAEMDFFGTPVPPEVKLAENADGSVTAIALGDYAASDAADAETITGYEIADTGAVYAVSLTRNAEGEVISTRTDVSGDDLFAVDGNGALTYAGTGEDFEGDIDHYLVTITATSSDGGTATQDVKVIIANVVDDNAGPVFTSPATASIAENIVDGDEVARVVATDADGDDVTYNLISVADGNGNIISGVDENDTVVSDLFVFATEDGEFVIRLKTGQSLNYERPGGQSYVFTITAASTHADTTNERVTDPHILTVSVTNVPESVSFDPLMAGNTGVLNENADGSTTPVEIGAYPASDDAGDDITYSASATYNDGTGDVDGSHLFAVDGNGVLTYVGAAIDFEDGNAILEYDVTITATSSDGSTATHDVTVSVRNLNDNELTFAPVSAPTVDDDGNPKVAENIAADYVIFTAAAADADTTDIAYSVSATYNDGTGDIPVSGLFEIDANGRVTLVTGQSLDYATAQSYRLTITATSTQSDGTVETETLMPPVTLTVEDINLNPVLFDFVGVAEDVTKPATKTSNGLPTGEVGQLFDGVTNTGGISQWFEPGDHVTLELADDHSNGYIRLFANGSRIAPSKTRIQFFHDDESVSDLIPLSGPTYPQYRWFTAAAPDGLFDKVVMTITEREYVGYFREFQLWGISPVAKVDLEENAVNVDLGTYPATDADVAPTEISYAIADTDAVYAVTITTRDEDGEETGSTRTDVSGDGLFAVDGSTGVLTYVGTGEDFEGSVDYYLVTITATSSDTSSATKQVRVTIADNSVPTLDVNAVLTVAPAQTLTITEANLDASDAEDSDEHIIFTLTDLPDRGTLQLRGDWDDDDNTAETWQDLALDGSFTQKDIADGDLQYVNTSGASGDTDSFVFSLNDDAENPEGDSIIGTFNITITDII